MVRWSSISSSRKAITNGLKNGTHNCCWCDDVVTKPDARQLLNEEQSDLQHLAIQRVLDGKCNGLMKPDTI